MTALDISVGGVALQKVIRQHQLSVAGTASWLSEQSSREQLLSDSSCQRWKNSAGALTVKGSFIALCQSFCIVHML